MSDHLPDVGKVVADPTKVLDEIERLINNAEALVAIARGVQAAFKRGMVVVENAEDRRVRKTILAAIAKLGEAQP